MPARWRTRKSALRNLLRQHANFLEIADSLSPHHPDTNIPNDILVMGNLTLELITFVSSCKRYIIIRFLRFVAEWVESCYLTR